MKQPLVSAYSHRPIKIKIIEDIDYQTPINSNIKKWSTCKKSTACCSTNQVNNKGPWTEQEDKKLINLVEKYGPEKWSFISSHFPERIGKQCRERWYNHLCPTVNKTAWSNEEEWILFILHNQMGNKWSQLCKYLPGRTDNTIKNHWNSTMKKKISQLQEEYDGMVKGKNEEEIKKIQEDILLKCKIVVEQENKKFYDEKMKNYEKFKNITVDNKQSMYKLKKILLFRTHSKKVKRRGRKKKYLTNEEKTTSCTKNYSVKNNNSVNRKPKRISQFRLSSKKEYKIKKKYGTPKNKKNKNKIKIGEPYVDENLKYTEKINLISSPIHKFVIGQEDLNESLKNKKNNNQNINTSININNNINIINNINSFNNENALLLNNYNNGRIEPTPISFNNNYIIYKNLNNPIYNDNNIEKNNLNSPELKDISLSTPIKLNDDCTPNFNNETNKIFIKTEKIFNESNNVLEKSAFNKQIINDIPFPYSSIKTHLCYTNSIKKPIKIISDESANDNMNLESGKTNNIQNEQNILLNNNELNNNCINGTTTSNNKKYFQNMENLTPNKLINFSENNGSNTMFKFNNIFKSSNKKQEAFNSSAIDMNGNNPYQVFSPYKNLTPFKISNSNLDKMFFSNINSKN